MMITRARLRSIGWAMILSVCLTLTLALTFKVNAVKSQVRLTERAILAARQDRDLLETEFETRASQHQLTALNNVEFGYVSPSSAQYVEGERELAMISKPRAFDAPSPIMVANATKEDDGGLPDLVSPLTGKAMAAEARPAPRRVADAADLGSRLAHVGEDKVAVASKMVRE